jgi:hypothetical protein
MIAFFQKIIGVLNESNIPYMLSGSVAMSIYIVPRATRDFDFVIHLEEKNIDRFIQHFQDGYYCDKDSIKDAVKRRSLFNIIDHASGFKADFVVLKNEPFRQEEFKRRKKVDFFDKTIYVVSPEDLLISKVIWIQDYQSAQQAEDIKNLTAIENMDWPYIKKWISKLNLKTFDLLPS